jgi:glycosyltransferase involved in cell wall biosynthesis
MKPVSCVVITRNEETNIARCLASLRWADEIVVVDSGSTDRTVEIARTYTAHVTVHAFSDFSSQKNFAVSLARNRWVFIVDADEVVPGALSDEIEALSPHLPYSAYRIKRISRLFGTTLRFGSHQDDAPLRLFDRTKCAFAAPVHESLVVDGKTGSLREPMIHYSTQTLSAYCRKLNSYTDLEAEHLMRQNTRGHIVRMCIRPPCRFLYLYVLKAGFRDRMAGFIYCWLSAFYTFLKEVKCWERAKNEVKGRKR